MMFSKNFVRKANQFRKQNWSAPTIMTAFILVCMMFIYSFETMGLLNKEKNLDWRITSPEKIIKTVAEIKVTNSPPSKPSENMSEKVLIEKLKFVSEKNKEDNYEQMMKILIDGAKNQMKYNNFGEDYNVFSNSNEEDLEFFDI